MSRTTTLAFAVTSLVALAACNDGTGPQADFTSSAFTSTIAGFNEVSSSFAGTGDASMAGLPWQPEHGMGGRGSSGPGGPGMGGFMGGGMDANFLGAIASGRGPDRGPFARTDDLSGCTLNGADLVCPPATRNGLTITRTLTIKNAAGATMSKIDSTTNSVRSQTTAAGTVQRRDSVTAVVSNSSDRTVTGLAVGSTVRTVNGKARGTENSTGKTRDGVAFTASRAMGDTTTGLTIPIASGKPTFPTAGTVIRGMLVTMTSGGKTTSSTRREVITSNGSATATAVITQDGTTKTCSLPLPFGRPVCQ